MKESIKKVLEDPYQNYIYSYPHKMSYREFKSPIELKSLWGENDAEAITLYIHIPFCISKCGYCNLMSSTKIQRDRIHSYVKQLINEIKAVGKFLDIKDDDKNIFSSVIFGGGTPSILEVNEIKDVLDAASMYLNIDYNDTFLSTEVSPRTLSEEKLNLFESYGIDRISMGIQSFRENELKNVHRFEGLDNIKKSIDLLFKREIPIRNLDLIYGIEGQTMETWKESLQKVVYNSPEELYIYPLYIRENTCLYSKAEKNIDLMKDMYEFAKVFLKSNGYIQTSMRNFIREDMKMDLYPEYSCQENAMIGIGCGARSYIGNVHYSRKYAVLQNNINEIIDEYIAETDFSHAKHGYILDQDEMKRRYIQKSILKVTGLDLDDYNDVFGESPENYDEFKDLEEYGFIERRDNRYFPTEKGLLHSDSIGPLFISNVVKQKIEEFNE
jgi:oxygen-independent coproporphyrinogen-3 oxidase